MVLPVGPTNQAGQPKDSELADLTDEQLSEKLNPPTPAPQADKVETAPGTKTPGTPEAVKQPEPEVEGKVDLVAENAKLQKQLANLQQVYGRQTNELGELRKKLKAEPTPEDFDADPVKAAKTLQERQRQEEEISKLEQEEAVHATAIRNLQFMTAHAPDINANAPVLREVLTQVDKLGEGDVNKFFGEILLQNPWGVYQLNERAKLYAEVKKLKAELEKAKKAPKEVTNRISDISKVTSNVSASTGASADPEKLGLSDDKVLAGLSDEELQEQLRKLNKG